MKEKDLKNKTKNKLKQAGMAGALVAAVVPTVAAVVVADENDFKKTNSSISYATAKANNSQNTQNATSSPYSTSSINVPKTDASGQNTEWQRLWISNPTSHQYDWVVAPYNGDTGFLSELNSFVGSYVTVTNQAEGIIDNLKKIELGQGAGSTQYFTLNLTGGLQTPNMTDSFMDHLAARYNAFKKTNVDKQQLKNAFKAYYVVEGDSEWHLLADANGNQNSGTNSFAIGNLSNYMVNGKIPNIHVAWLFNFDSSIVPSNQVSTIPDSLKKDLQGLGATYTILGGARPATMFKTMSDYSDFYSDSSIALPSFVDTRGQQASSINDYLTKLLDNIVSGINYTGDTAKTIVNLSQTFDFTQDSKITGFFEQNHNYTPFELAHNKAGAKQVYPSFYYSVGEEVSIHKVPNGQKQFVINNWNSNLIKSANGQGPYLNDIHYYIALNAPDASNGEKIIAGWDSISNKYTNFYTVGVRADVTSYDPTTGATKAQFKNIKDIVSMLEAPKPKDDTKPTRNVEENPQLGLINNADSNGLFHRNPNVFYKYRIVGTNAWFSKNDFFGVGKPGSTPEALSSGTEWLATTTAEWDPALIPSSPAGSHFDHQENGFIGKVGWNLPLISQIDEPKFKATNSINYTIDLPTNNIGIAYKFRLVNPEKPTETLAWPNKSNGEWLTFTEFSQLAITPNLPNLFNQSNGKFWAIEWMGEALNPQSPKKSETGIYHITADDLPKPNIHAIVRDDESDDSSTPIFKDAQPKIDYQKTTNTANINIKLPSNNVFNYVFSLEGGNFDLHLDANGFLVNANGTKVNVFDGATVKSISWKLGIPPVGANSNVDFSSKLADHAVRISISGLKKYVDIASAFPMLKGDSTVDFNIDETGQGGSKFAIPFEYSLNKTDWYSLADFNALSPSGDDILHTNVQGFANDSRNLFDPTTKSNKTIYFRTVPSGSSVTGQTTRQNYEIDPVLASSHNMTFEQSDATWHGSFDTSSLKKDISTDLFWNNIPTITGTETTNFYVTVPNNIPNVNFEFKFDAEEKRFFTDWNSFKQRVGGNWTEIVNGKAIVKHIVWRAVVSDPSKYVFENTTLKGKGLNLIDTNSQFVAQDLKADQVLTAKVPLKVDAPTLDGDNTENVRLKGHDQTGMTYEYSLDSWKTSHTFDEFNDAQKGQALRNELINTDGKTLKDISWKVRFDDPFVPENGAVIDGTLSTSKVKIWVSSITPLGANILSGTDSWNWKIDTSKIPQIGVNYKIVIGGKEYAINDQLLQNSGTLNLFNQDRNDWLDISWKAEIADGFTFGGKQLVDHGTITPTLKRFIQKINTPLLNGIQSDQYTIFENGDNAVKFEYQSDKVTTWKDKTGFTNSQGNVWNDQNSSFYNIEFKVTPISDEYVIDSSILGLTSVDGKSYKGKVEVDVSDKVVGAAPAPAVTGNTTKDYVLFDTLPSSHAIYHYWSTDAEKQVKEMTYAEFKAAHPNLWDQTSGKLIPIHYSVQPEHGFNFPAETNKTVTMGIDKLKKIIEVAKLPTLSVDASSGNTGDFTPKSSTAIPTGVEFVYSTSQTGTFKSLQDFLASEKNLYDVANGTLKSVYYKASIAAVGTNAIDYAFDNTTLPVNTLNIDSLPKLIDNTFVAPKITSTTGKTNDWDVDAPNIPHVKIEYWTSASTSTIKDTDPKKIGLPVNIFRGKDAMPVVKWEATLESNDYVWKTGVSTSGDFNKEFDALTKVYDSNTLLPAPTLSSPSPTNWQHITEVTPPGVVYKYYLEGEDPTKAQLLTDFQNSHSTTSIYANGKWLDIHFVVSLDPNNQDGHTYELVTNSIALDRKVTISNQRTVITNVVEPHFDLKTTTDTHTFGIAEDDHTRITTLYTIKGANPSANNLTYAELMGWIKNNHNGNLWDQSSDTLLQIDWTVQVADTSTDIDPSTKMSGTLSYADAIAQNKMKKFILPATPTFGGTSTKTGDVVLGNLDPIHFDYRFSRNGTGSGNEGKWVSLPGVYNNFYDAQNGTFRTLFWKATPKAGFTSGATPKQGQITIPQTMVKYIDVINESTLTGNATDDYHINEQTTNGVKITYSTNASDLNSFKSKAEFENDLANKNIAGKTIYYLVTTTSNDYTLDQTKFAQPITLSANLKKALDTFVVPTFTANSKSNSWTIDTLDSNVDYLFEVKSLGTGWVSAADLLTKVGDKLFDSKTNSMLQVDYKVKAKSGNVFGSALNSWTNRQKTGVDTELLGEVDTTGVTHVVTDVTAPYLSWSGSDKKSNNYIIKAGDTTSVDYFVSIGNKNSYEPLSQATIKNLYDSAIGNQLKIYWKAVPKGTNEKVQPWTFDDQEINEQDITTWVIDSVQDAALIGINNAAPESKAFSFTTPSTNVEYYFVDVDDATPKLESLTDFANNAEHTNLFNSDTFTLDTVKFVVKATNGFELASTITNSYANGIQNAKEVDFSQMIKVMEKEITPQLSGQADNWNVETETKFAPGLTYTFRIADTSESFADLAATKTAHSNIDFNNKKHDVEWQVALSPLYKLGSGIANHGTLDSKNLDSDLEIKHISKPTISFTDTHKYDINSSSKTINVVYKFGIEGEDPNTFQEFDQFKTAHPNLFDAAKNELKNIAWTATPSTAGAYHFNTTDAQDGVINIQHEKRFIDLLPAPTLVDPSALSTALDFNEPAPYNGYVTYKYSIDNQGSYTKDQLIAEYAKLNWNNNTGVIKFDATVPTYDANGVNYAIGQKATQTIDTSKIIKVVDPSALELDAASKTTSEYSFISNTTVGLTYSVSIDGKKTWIEFLAFDPQKTPLFTLDDGLKTVDWKVEAETGYALKPGAKTDGTIDISSLKKIIDKVPAPVLGGSDTTDYSVTIDTKTNGLFEYKYSFDPQAAASTFVSFADLKKSTEGINIYDLTQGVNRPIYYLPVATGNVDFAVTPSVQSISTQTLVSVIDTITQPTLTTASKNSDAYDIVASQHGVDFTFSTDQNDASSYVPLADFLKDHKNIYNNDNWTLPNIYWKASASTQNVNPGQTVKFGTSAVASGTIDTQNLIKVIDKMPQIGATGTTVNFNETVFTDPNQALLNIPGLTFSFEYNHKHYSTLADLVTSETSSDPDFNLWNVRNDQMGSITFDITKIDPKYVVKNASDKTGSVNLTKLVKMIDFIDTTAWVPQTKTGSNYDHYDFAISNLPSHLQSLFDYKYAVDKNAQSSDWYDLATFKTKYPNLMKNYSDPQASDHSIMSVFYKIDLKNTTDYQYIQPDLKGVKEEIKLGIKNVIFNVPAPVVDKGNLHNGLNGAVGQTHPTSRTFEVLYPEPHIDYVFQIGGSGQWLTFDQLLKTSGFNTYDSVNNQFKDVMYEAKPKDGYQFATGRPSQQGNVDMDNSGVTKVIEKVVVPVLSGADTLHYDFALPQGAKEFTKGLDYLLKIEGETQEHTPAEWVAAGKNLFDVIHNKNLKVSYVLRATAGYSVIDPNSTGDLTLPQNMMNVIDNVTPPQFKAITNTLTTEDWDIVEQGTNGFTFKYSIDNGTTFLSKADLLDVLRPMFHNIYDNKTEVMKSILWKAVVTDSSKYSINVSSSGMVDVPRNIIRAIDDVQMPTIPDNSISNNYSFVESTKNVRYEYKLAFEDATHWATQADFIKNHPNLYDMDAQQLRVVEFRAIANNGYVLTSNARVQGGNLDMNKIVTYVLSRVPAVSVAPNGTTRTYRFIPDETKTGIEYEYGLSETGPFESQADFITHHKNLFDADNGLSDVYWHAKTTSTTFRFDYGLTLVGKIDLSSLTKVVDKDAEIPKFTANSSTIQWEFEPLDQQGAWIDHYEFKMDGDSVGWRTLADFKNTYPNLTKYKDAGTNVYWKAVVNSPEYEWGTNNRRDGQVDLSVLQQKYTTQAFDLSKITFAVTNDNKYTPVYDGKDGLPEPTQADGFHLEYAWGDQPNQWISDSVRSWVFHQTLPPMELWENDHANTNGTAGAWKHGGKITFKFVPNSVTSGVDNDQATTIDFEDLVTQKQILKIISNPRISINNENHVPGDDIHVGFLPKYTSSWDEKTNLVSNSLGAKEGSDSILPLLGLWFEKPINNYDVVLNPFEGMTSGEVDQLINSMTGERLVEIQGLYPQYVPASLGLDQIKDVFRKTWLTQKEAIQFFLMADNIWTGSEWKINSISVKSLAKPGFKVIQEAQRTVWSNQDKTIAKITDNTKVIKMIEDAIKPEQQVGSVHDSVVWGDKSQIQAAIDLATNKQHLKIELSIDRDANGDHIWHTLADLDDPNDFFNAVTKINPDHAKRELWLQVHSVDTDEATGQEVKVVNEDPIDITQESGIQRVKTRITATGKYNTQNIKITGYTDGDIDIDESIVTESYLQVTYEIKEAPGVWRTKDEAIDKIKELRSLGTNVYGEDIKARIGLKDSLSDKYSLGQKIEGTIDFTHLYTHADVTKYVDALKKDVELIGTPRANTLQSGGNATMYVTFDNSIITSSDFTNFYGVQYRINDSKTWELFKPSGTLLDKDVKNNIIKPHEAGSYMPLNVVVGDKVYFRIVPIATANGNVVITSQDANHSQQELFAATRVKSSDWNGTPNHEGTIVERDTSELLLSGEHQLLDLIDDNFKATSDLLLKGERPDETWINSFLALVTSRPRFEVIQDAAFDPLTMGKQEILNILNDGDEVDRLVNKGIITIDEKNIIAETIKTSSPVRDANGNSVAWSEVFVDKDGKVIRDANGKIDLNVKEDADHIKRHLNTAPQPGFAFVADFMRTHPEIIKKLYMHDDVEREALDFNKDLIQAGESSFEITQIGDGNVDQYGQNFTHSNTIFFGTNAIRFNVHEDISDQSNHIVDAYFIGEDSTQKENKNFIDGDRIAKIHISTQYSLENMALVLELVNGETVYIEKSIDGSSQDEVVRFARIASKVDANTNKQLDIENNGGIWKYASESLIEKNVHNTDVDAATLPGNEDVKMQESTLKKTTRHWIASAEELKDHTDKNELPYTLTMFDNGDESKNAIILSLTDQEESEFKQDPTKHAGAIYMNEVGKVVEWFANGSTVTGSAGSAVSTTNGNTYKATSLVMFDTLGHFADEQKFIREQVYEQSLRDAKTREQKGYMVVKSAPDAKGLIHLRAIEQSIKSVIVNDISMDPLSGKVTSGKNFPTWAIILASAGTAGILGGAYGGYLWYNKHIAKKAARLRRPTMSIKFRKK